MEKIDRQTAEQFLHSLQAWNRVVSDLYAPQCGQASDVGGAEHDASEKNFIIVSSNMSNPREVEKDAKLAQPAE